MIYSKKFPISKSLNTPIFHKTIDAIIPILIKGNKKLLELWHFLFRNDQHSTTLRNKIMICKNNRCPFISICKYLRFHTI